MSNNRGGNFQSPYQNRGSGMTGGYNSSPSQFAPGGGGGGFMTPPAPSAGMFDTSGADSGNRKTRSSAEKQSLTPVTIKQIFSATQNHPDDLFRIDGRELAQITFVGQIMSVEEQPTNLTFVIDDSTARIQVKMWTDSEDADLNDRRRQECRKGAYVRVSGHVRSFNDEKNVVAFNVRPVLDMNELTHHYTEVAFVHIHNTNSGKTPLPAFSSGAGVGIGGGAMRGGPTAHTQAGMGQGSASLGRGVASSGGGDVQAVRSVLDQAVGFSPAQIAVIKAFNSMEASADTGLHISKIFASLAAQGFSQPMARSAIDFLIGEGHLYSTLDDNFLQISHA